MNIEAREQEQGFLTMVVQGNEIVDLRRVLRWIDEERPDLRQTYDISRPTLEPKLLTSAERDELGFRFVDYWHFDKVAA